MDDRPVGPSSDLQDGAWATVKALTMKRLASMSPEAIDALVSRSVLFSPQQHGPSQTGPLLSDSAVRAAVASSLNQYRHSRGAVAAAALSSSEPPTAHAALPVLLEVHAASGGQWGRPPMQHQQQQPNPASGAAAAARTLRALAAHSQAGASAVRRAMQLGGVRWEPDRMIVVKLPEAIGESGQCDSCDSTIEVELPDAVGEHVVCDHLLDLNL